MFPKHLSNVVRYWLNDDSKPTWLPTSSSYALTHYILFFQSIQMILNPQEKCSVIAHRTPIYFKFLTWFNIILPTSTSNVMLANTHILGLRSSDSSQVTLTLTRNVGQNGGYGKKLRNKMASSNASIIILLQAYKNFLKHRVNQPQITLPRHRFTFNLFVLTTFLELNPLGSRARSSYRIYLYSNYT